MHDIDFFMNTTAKDPGFWFALIVTLLVVAILHRPVHRLIERLLPKRTGRTSMEEVTDAIIVSEASLSIGRNSAVGGAAVCLLVLLAVVQMPARDRALDVAVYAAAVAIPTLLCSAGFYEMILSMRGPGSEWLLSESGKTLFFLPLVVGIIALIISVGSVFAHFPGNVVYLFAMSGGVAVIYALLGQWLFARWLRKRNEQAMAPSSPPSAQAGDGSTKRPG